jgi:hypothetical protein
MTQAVIRRSLRAEARVRARASQYGYFGKEIATGIFFCEFFGVSLSVSLHRNAMLMYQLADEQWAHQ